MDKRAENNLNLSILKTTSYSPSLPPPGNSPGERIRWARLTKNLTIAELAKSTNLHVSTITAIENDYKIPNISTVRAIAEILEQQIWYLGCYETLPTDTLGQQIKKSRLYAGLTKKEFAKALSVNEKTIRLWETDISTPTSESMQKLSRFLVQQ